MNIVTLIGRIGVDPELKKTKAGKDYVNFTLATTENYGEQKEVSWHRLEAFSGAATLIAQYCKKGHLIGVTGRIRYYSVEIEGKVIPKTVITIEKFEFLEKK